MHASWACAVPQDRREPPRADASGTTGRGSTAVSSDVPRGPMVRTVAFVKPPQRAFMRLRVAEVNWKSPWEQTQPTCHDDPGCNYRGISRVLPRVITVLPF
jgi:hypothetical protein